MGQRSLRKPTPWLQHVVSGAQSGDACLVCVPPAGGGAGAYWTWTQWLPPHVDLLLVQPPGREDRHAEPPEWTLDELRRHFAQAMPTLPDVPYFVLGHSMGGLVGTHIATWLAPVRDLRRLIVSSCRPDPVQSRLSRVFPGGRADRIDPEQLALLSGIGVEEWRRLPGEFQASLRRRWYADLSLSAELPVPSEPVLDCPVTAWLGDRDLMTDGEMTGWSKLTSGPCEVQSWPGGHGYLFARPSPVRKRLVELLDLGLGE